MRTRFAVLMLFAVLPVMNVLGAPAPDPYAILDLGPPPKGETWEQYRKRLIGAQTHHFSLTQVWSDPEVKKLPSVARFKDPRPWMAKNLRVTPDEGERRIRFTFRGGTRIEQMVILNALLRNNLHAYDDTIKWSEEVIRIYEKNILELEERIKSAPESEVASYRKGIDDLRSFRIPELRAEIDSQKKRLTVIKWAR